MKNMARALLCLVPLATGVRHNLVREASIQLGHAGLVDHSVSGTETVSRATASLMVGKMLAHQDMKVKGIINAVQEKISIDEASDALDGFKGLPPDVAQLVRLAGKTNKTAQEQKPFDEDSIQKARGILNGMIETAWLELDDVIFESKEFEERNRGTYEQVVNDLSRLGSQLASLEEKRMAANSAISSFDSQRTELDGIFEGVTQSFTTLKNSNQQELTRRKNDLAVFDFILNMTRCKEGQTLLQVEKSGDVKRAKKMQVCSSKDGELSINFDNKVMQHRFEKLMTPDARLALRAALGQFQGKTKLLQLGEQEGNSTTSQQIAVVVPVTEDPHPDGQWKKCVDGEENCGLLHDLMSLEWGKFRDEVDELTATMLSNQQQYDAQQTNYNQQCAVITDGKTAAEESLAEAVSNINADTQEMGEKDEQKEQLTVEFDKEMAIFRATISEILHTKICAVRKVRNGIAAHSDVSPPSQISDCDVSDWASKTGECFSPGGAVITCDDACPHPTDPYQCGGMETMKRDIVVLKNQYGISCPPLERQKKCGQKKCEVHCSMSEWSSWSACSKECEGGVQVKTRSILVKPKHGGRQCDAPQEERPCHTGSCDRDCSLNDWTMWDFCSMACGGGTTTRTRSVLVPIRGQGTCPEPSHVDRLEVKECNEHSCIGDEVCIAKQDLVIAMDASGSLKQGGFEIVKNFTGNLTKKYQSVYFGSPAMKIGLVVFGNGHLEFQEDGSAVTSAALAVQPLTDDFSLLHTKVMEQTWQRGYTNMAQAFAAADKLLAQNGREDAQSAVLLITDGRYSMAYQTFEKARELKDKNVMVLMAAITDWSGPDLEPLQRLVTYPPETNFHKIPGLAALKANTELYAQQIVAKFCPNSVSPSNLLSKDQELGFYMIRKNGQPSADCLEAMGVDIGIVNTPTECAEAAREAGHLGFWFGRGPEAGVCYTDPYQYAQSFWDDYVGNRANPPCPSMSGPIQPPNAWEFNPHGDVYVISPSSMSIQ